MESKRLKIHPAFIAAWASVIAAGHIVPTVPFLATGFSFSLSHILTPLAGIFFGPVTGALCTAIGGFIGNLIAPHTAWMGPFTFIVSTVTAFTTGCIAWNKSSFIKINNEGSFIINGAVIVYLLGTILWFTQKTGREWIWLPVVYYGLGFASAVAGFILAGKFLASEKRILKFPALWFCAFAGLIGGAAIGNFFGLAMGLYPVEIWAVLTFRSPIERALFAAVTMIIGVPLLEGLEKLGIFTAMNNENRELGIRNREEGTGRDED